MAAMLGGLFGGVGLFLLGMALLTDGLKLAAGGTLSELLARGTATPLRGVAAGAGVTALVQSSSAVTVATIGFVNAGLLPLAPAIWVVIGSNLGTTMTGWIVALVGIKLDVAAAALPAIGLGMLLRLSGERGRRGAWGQALAGFGLLFLGIAVLQEAFADLGQRVDLAAWIRPGVLGVLIACAAGFALTVLVQSSSAAIAVTLTAAAGGALPLEPAAAVVIGANLGTTATAVLATLGATPNARRVASAHVLFNLVTGLIALAVLPVMLRAVALAQDGLDLGHDLPTTLALFHTAFNLLGVVAVLPWSRRLASLLTRRFRTQEEDLARPRHLDATLREVPALAVQGLAEELRRLHALAVTTALTALTAPEPPPDGLEARRAAVHRLAAAIREFVAELNRAVLPARVAALLPDALRATQHAEDVAELAATPLVVRDLDPAADGPLAERAAALADAARAALAAAVTEPFDPGTLASCEAAIERSYGELKAALLEAASARRLAVARMDRLIRAAGALRHGAERALKSARRLHRFMAHAAGTHSSTAVPAEAAASPTSSGRP